MKSFLHAVALLSAIVLAPTARAQVAIDVKAGYAWPTGNIATATTVSSDRHGALSKVVSGAIPLEIAARYRFTPRFSAGIYFQYGPAFVAAYSCLASFSCSASNVRVGAEAVYAFLPDSTFNPWVSLGSGWEWLNQTVDIPSTPAAPASTQNLGLNGWEWFNLQVGADWNLSKMFAAGPYVGFFGGQYSSATDNGGSRTIASANRQFHGWVQVGLKGTVNL
jgi:hypothetical protein